MGTFSFSEEYSFSEARRYLTNIAMDIISSRKRVVLTRKGKRVVALIPIEDLEALQAIEDILDLADSKKALADVKKHGTVPQATIKRKLKL